MRLILQQRRNRGRKAVSRHGLVRVVPQNAATQVGQAVLGFREGRRAGHLADEDLAVGRGEHQVTWPHPADEPVELGQPLLTIGVRLVLITLVHRLPEFFE